jgi:hypothetical protein
MSYATVETAFGAMMVAATDRGVSFVQFADHESKLLEILRGEYPMADLKPMAQPCHPDFSKWISALRDHLASRPSATLRSPARHSCHSLPDESLELSAVDSVRSRAILWRSCCRYRRTQGGPRRRTRLREQQDCRSHPMSSRYSRNWGTRRIQMGLGQKTRNHRFGTKSGLKLKSAPMHGRKRGLIAGVSLAEEGSVTPKRFVRLWRQRENQQAVSFLLGVIKRSYARGEIVIRRILGSFRDAVT